MSRKSWTVFWLAALLLLFVFNGSLLITDSGRVKLRADR